MYYNGKMFSGFNDDLGHLYAPNIQLADGRVVDVAYVRDAATEAEKAGRGKRLFPHQLEFFFVPHHSCWRVSQSDAGLLVEYLHLAGRGEAYGVRYKQVFMMPGCRLVDHRGYTDGDCPRDMGKEKI